MGMIGDAVSAIKATNVRHIALQAISLGMIVTSALIIWKGLMCFTGSESPVVVVLSGSMEPGFRRGDILFLHMSKAPIRAGEIVVFHVDGRDIPIVHRVIKGIITWGMIEFFMHMVKCGSKGITSWGGQWDFYHMLGGSQLS
ncbi:hypothetical protein CY35_01G184100 [Sphagnum magellanicum]|nr:hypothetical protein CY35_01G184100 [Sphagnum magellanicum]